VNNQNFGQEQGLFEYLFGISEDQLGEYLIFSPFMKIDTSSFRIEKRFKGRLFKGVIFKIGDKKTSLIWTGIGVSLVGDAVMSLKRQYKGVFLIGSAGGIGEMKIGDILIVNRAYSGEGFSLYLDRDFEVSYIFKSDKFYGSPPEIKERFTFFLEDKVKEGPVFTIGSIFAARAKTIEYLNKKGIKAIEMEVSGFYAACKKRRLPALALLFISDIPQKKPFWKKFSYKEKETIKKAKRTCQEIIWKFIASN
jgi:nucleoside phosphorylase